MNRLERAVFTLEDPIEYRLPHIRQTQVNDKIGLTFGSGLRTLLRQDPDVLLVGETRDKETAQLMVRAALTGHLVFSSLHTNDSFSAIPRLIDLGVEPFLLPATLHLVVAQRLVRRLCMACREPVADPAATLRAFNLRLARGRGTARSGSRAAVPNAGTRATGPCGDLRNARGRRRLSPGAAPAATSTA